MKKEFSSIPESFKETWPGEFSLFSWQDFLTAIPSPIFVATSYKANGKENACLQSWSAFVGDVKGLICIMAAVNRSGHLYTTIMETGVCVLNFPAADIYDKCSATITNNDYDNNEITDSGLTSEHAVTIHAPRIKECFLNIECEFLWERPLYDGCNHSTIALLTKHIAMDSDYYDEGIKGRYGKTGFIYNIHSPRNADTGECLGDKLGFLETL
jgi:flavin reductase (DIM6/NTAB) family NADH-FMN oxidoreductase RutF